MLGFRILKKNCKLLVPLGINEGVHFGSPDIRKCNVELGVLIPLLYENPYHMGRCYCYHLQYVYMA